VQKPKPGIDRGVLVAPSISLGKALLDTFRHNTLSTLHLSFSLPAYHRRIGRPVPDLPISRYPVPITANIQGRHLRRKRRHFPPEDRRDFSGVADTAGAFSGISCVEVSDRESSDEVSEGGLAASCCCFSRYQRPAAWMGVSPGLQWAAKAGVGAMPFGGQHML
jgi:hypothetical protein